MELNPTQVESFLDQILACNSDLEYERALVAFGKTLSRSAKISLSEGEKWLRRRSIRRTDYRFVSGEYLRLSRNGLAWSWCENRILDWAANPGVESKRKPDAAYLAVLLNRTVEEVEKKIQFRRNVLHGIRGFDL